MASARKRRACEGANRCESALQAVTRRPHPHRVADARRGRRPATETLQHPQPERWCSHCCSRHQKQRSKHGSGSRAGVRPARPGGRGRGRQPFTRDLLDRAIQYYILNYSAFPPACSPPRSIAAGLRSPQCSASLSRPPHAQNCAGSPAGCLLCSATSTSTPPTTPPPTST